MGLRVNGIVPHTPKFECHAVLGYFFGLVGTTVGGFFDFPGFDTAHANIDTAYRPVQKENFHPLNVRHETAARDAGGLDADPARFLLQTAASDRISHKRFLVAESARVHKALIIVRRCSLASGFF